ncbi:hypothetical protein PIROE2DRAFT_5230 [Piromyces sp. E2]|nr:hypothetical protein PIROE2DRAFT_5230 [Piromyces sp. E2]|eukprot:OUM67367.1 hypothetical protein PIROE2DRAFT_5230 [Piromyces sp. E2]
MFLNFELGQKGNPAQYHSDQDVSVHSSIEEELDFKKSTSYYAIKSTTSSNNFKEGLKRVRALERSGTLNGSMEINEDVLRKIKKAKSLFYELGLEFFLDL